MIPLRLRGSAVAALAERPYRSAPLTQQRAHFTTSGLRYAAPPRAEDVPSLATEIPAPVYVAVDAPPKPKSFVHMVSYQKNPDNRVTTPMRVYQSRQPTLLPQVRMYDSVAEFMLERWQAQDPQKVCATQVETGEQITYEELLKRTRQVKSSLYNFCGVRKGDTVLLCMPNTINYAPIVYGAMCIAAVVSTSKMNITSELLADHLEACGAKVVVTSRSGHCVVQKAAQILRKRTEVQVKIMLEETIISQKVEETPYYLHLTRDAQRNDTVLIPFSAGTSGLPRGVKLSNINLISNALQTIHDFQMTSADVHLGLLPFSHMAGFMLSMTSTLAAGGTLVVLSAFSARAYVSAITMYGCTSAVLAPPIVTPLIRQIKAAAPEHQASCSSLRLIRSTGAPLSPQLWAALCETFPNASIGQVYSMTEMSSLALSTPLITANGNVGNGNDGADSGSSEAPVIRKKRYQNTSVVGALVADTEMRVVSVDESQQSSADVSSGIDVDEGGEGEIWLRGPQRMVGFVNPLVSRMVLQDQWYRTGDIGYVNNETGHLCMTDRLRELIKYKGYYISPAQVEKVLAQCPEIAECVVIGVPDARDTSFEHPRALVKLAPDAIPADLSEDAQAEELQRLEKKLIHHVEAALPVHKHLRGGVCFVDDIPKTASGNVQRRNIRKMELERMRRVSAPSSPWGSF